MTSIRSKRIAPGRYAILLDGELVGHLKRGATSVMGTRIHNDWHLVSAISLAPEDVAMSPYPYCHIPRSGAAWLNGVTEPNVFRDRYATKAAALREIEAFLIERHDDIVELRQRLAAAAAERRRAS